MEGLGADLSEGAAPPEEWFAAAAGLVTVRALLQHVDTHLDSFPSGAAVASRTDWLRRTARASGEARNTMAPCRGLLSRSGDRD